MAEEQEHVDVFEDPVVAEIWMNVADMTGDAAVAKQVIAYLGREMWNLPWPTWARLVNQSA